MTMATAAAMTMIVTRAGMTTAKATVTATAPMAIGAVVVERNYYRPVPPPRVYRPYGYERGHRYYNYYAGPTYVVRDYDRYRVRYPPHGYHWVRDDRGNLILVAIATGIITDLLLNH